MALGFAFKVEDEEFLFMYAGVWIPRKFWRELSRMFDRGESRVE